MKNHWLNRFRTGKRVRYKGADNNLSGKVGYIVKVQGEWVDVQFEFTTSHAAHTKIISVEKDNLEIV